MIEASRYSANIGNSRSPSAGTRRRITDSPSVSMRKNGLVPPALGGFPFAGSPVFGQRRFRLLALPAERPPFVNGMKGVDEQDYPQERQPGGGGAAAETL